MPACLISLPMLDGARERAVVESLSNPVVLDDGRMCRFSGSGHSVGSSPMVYTFVASAM